MSRTSGGGTGAADAALAGLRGFATWYAGLFIGLGVILIAIMGIGAIFSSDVRGQLLLQSHVIHGTVTGHTRDSRCGRHTAATDVQVQWQEDGRSRIGWLQICGVNRRLHWGWPYDALPRRGQAVEAQATGASDTLHYPDKDNIYLTMLKALLFAPLLLLAVYGLAMHGGDVFRRVFHRGSSTWLPG